MTALSQRNQLLTLDSVFQLEADIFGREVKTVCIKLLILMAKKKKGLKEKPTQAQALQKAIIPICYSLFCHSLSLQSDKGHPQRVLGNHFQLLLYIHLQFFFFITVVLDGIHLNRRSGVKVIAQRCTTDKTLRISQLVQFTLVLVQQHRWLQTRGSIILRFPVLFKMRSQYCRFFSARILVSWNKYTSAVLNAIQYVVFHENNQLQPKCSTELVKKEII